MDQAGCPNLVSARTAWPGMPLLGHVCKWKMVIIHRLASARIWQSDCEYGLSIFNSFPRRQAMLGELRTIPTHTLIDMLSIILAGGDILSASDVDELEQIQRELQRRDTIDHCMLGRPN